MAQPFAYVTNSSSSNISVIDTRTYTVVETFSVGRSAASIAITPNGRFAYVAEYFLNNVSVISASTNTVITNVPVGNRPRDVAITPDGRFVYVTCELGGTVNVIDTAIDTVVASVKVGTWPRGIAITPDGRFAYVANNFSRNVSVIEIASNTVIATVGVGVEPWGMAVRPDGSHAEVVTYLQNLVSSINTTTNTVAASVVAGSRPREIAITPDSRFAYVTVNNAANVAVIDLSNHTVFANVPVGDNPSAIAITPDGNFAYVGTRDFAAELDTVAVVSLATNSVVAKIAVGSGASAIAFTPPAPEIAVEFNGVAIASGDDTPDAADGTDFGNSEIAGGFVARRFTIANSGALDLNLTGALPRVQVSGPNASEFTVLVPANTPVTAGGSTTFMVHYHPDVLGLHAATFSIASNDPDEDPYEFAVQGTGVAPSPGLLFLAERNITIAQASTEGSLHSNQDITFKPGKSNTYTGNVTAVEQITIQAKNTIVGDVAAGGTVSNSGTVTGSIVEGAVVTAESLPTLSFSAGGDNVTVQKNAVLSLAPGSYNNVSVLKGGTLQLSSGEYFMNGLTLADQSILEANIGGAEIAINVVAQLSFGKKSQVSILPGGESATEQLAFTKLGSGEVKVLSNAKVLGWIIAPGATVSLASNSTFKGMIIANIININKGVVALTHGSSSSLPKLSPDFDESDDAEELELTALPTAFSLEQNYPNPFNPETTISFALPKASEVSLSIYNLRGQLVRSLVSGNLAAGNHHVVWDAKNERGVALASGLYLYVLRAGDFTAQRKLVLMR